MDVTFLQILGVILSFVGVYTFFKGEIHWSIEAGPGTGARQGMHFDLTPDKYKYKKNGVYAGKLVNPIAFMLCVSGVILIFVFPGDSIAFSL